MTLAKLALEQDDRPLALATLASLIERDPDNSEARALLDDLRAEDEAVEAERRRAARATCKIAALQAWLDTVRLAAGKRDRGLS
jgi:TorA maturation chaperone TorD